MRDPGDAEDVTAAGQWAIDSGDPEAAPMAARELGLLLEGQGDTEGAAAAYQQAIDSGHADHAPMAAVNLGVLLRRQGDTDGATAAYLLPAPPKIRAVYRVRMRRPDLSVNPRRAGR